MDGRSYEIDLSDENVTELRRSLQPFVSVARKITPARRRRR
ncbi:histone-like nucleoid-structuring protein Lsr2 [Plantibacter sp. ME-Dv--P-095]